VTVKLIGRDELAWGDLSQYGTIVTGVRAYERRDDLRAHNNRLLEYVQKGGTLIVQYNKFEFNEAQYGPYPAKVSSNRVTDERAPVQVLAPANPVFTTPNRIGPDDWAGWVQERGLYFLGDRDPQYTDLVQLEIRSRTTPARRPARSSRPVSARAGGSTWASACGASCRRRGRGLSAPREPDYAEAVACSL